MEQEQVTWFAETFEKLVANIEQAVISKTHVVSLTLTCLLADGHMLLEDVPGTGKTSLARALANTVQGSHSRVQFTPDLLPSDITGVNIYDQRTGTFEFHKGPIFATIVLADEINRASPKTQSALLEVMNGPWNPVGIGPGGTGNIGSSYGQTITVFLWAVDTCGLSNVSQGTATAPSPTISIGRGASSAACSGCYWVNVSGSNFPPNASITFTCSDGGGQFWVNPGVNPGVNPDYPFYSAWYSTNAHGSLGWVVTSNPGKSCAHSPGASVTVTVTAGRASASATDGSF